MDAGNDLGIFLSLSALAIIDWILLGCWVKGYYMFGVPLYQKSFTYTGNHNNKTLINYLENHLKNISQPFILHVLDVDKVAFRAQDIIRPGFFTKSKKAFNPMIHGAICFDHNSRKVTVIAILNWSYFLFTLGFLTLIGAFKGDYNYTHLVYLALPLLLTIYLYKTEIDEYKKIIEMLKNILGSKDD